MVSTQRIRWVAMAAAIATYGLIILGVIVRTTGSGLGCPDWPLCYGQVVPPPRVAAWIEFSHRMAASVITVLIVTTAFLLWRRERRFTLSMRLVALALILLGGEILLGGITVLMELPPAIVAIHLTNALIILGLMVMVSLILWRPTRDETTEDARLYRPVLWSLGATFVVLVLGTVVTGTGAGWACLQWPTCAGSWLFRLNPLTVIHMIHRTAVVAAGVFLFATVWWTIRHRTSRALRHIALLTLAFYLAEIGVGAYNVWTRFNTWVNALHLALAALIWALHVAMFYFAARSRLLPASGYRDVHTASWQEATSG